MTVELNCDVDSVYVARIASAESVERSPLGLRVPNQITENTAMASVECHYGIGWSDHGLPNGRLHVSYKVRQAPKVMTGKADLS